MTRCGLFSSDMDADMTFKLTYSTMFSPPAELHARFDEAMGRTLRGLGRRHGFYIDGEDRPDGAAVVAVRSPIDQELVVGEFAVAGVAQAEAALQAAHRAWAGWKRTPPAQRAELLRRAGRLIEERVFDIAAALTLEVGKNRMEALGEAQETADFFVGY